MIKKEGQAWGMDLTFAAMIFIAGIVAFYLYTINYKSSEGSEVDEARFEADLIAASLLSEGIPSSWTTTTVSKIGVINEGKINETKLAMVYNMSQLDYSRTKNLFGIRYDYFINLSETMVIEGTARAGIGREPNQSAKNTIKITRFTNYQNKPVTLEVSAWKS